MSLGRFDVDTSTVPRRPISAVGADTERHHPLSRSTASSFKLLAATSCRILTGCKRRSLKARASGARQATADLADWITKTHPGQQVPCAALSGACNQLLSAQERPTSHGAAGPALASTGGPGTGLVMQMPTEREAESNQEEGPWDAVDSAFSDDLFRAGAMLFTQFYKGNIRLFDTALRLA